MQYEDCHIWQAACSQAAEPGFVWGKVSSTPAQEQGLGTHTILKTWISVTLDLNRSVPQMVKLVRPAQIDGEKAALCAFLSTHLSPEASFERYEWLYCKNPAGNARVWI